MRYTYSVWRERENTRLMEKHLIALLFGALLAVIVYVATLNHYPLIWQKI
jgi:hypothetical protein